MTVYWRLIALGLTWWAALMAALQLTHLPGEWGHVICGPWGCGPRPQALFACHAFWIVVALPLVGIPIRCWSPRRVQLFGLGLLSLGAAGLVGVGVWQAVTDSTAEYMVQRYLFLLGTLHDVPIVQVTLAGAVCWMVGSRRRRTRPVQDEALTEA